MSHTLAVSILLRPGLADVNCGFSAFMDVGAKLKDISRDVSSPYVAYLASLKDDLRWLRLFELPDPILEELATRLRADSNDSGIILDAIADTLNARDEFRASIPAESLREALHRNQIRTRLEGELGHSLSKQSAYSWAAKQGNRQEMDEFFEGFFTDVRSRISAGDYDPQPILLCAVEADRIT